MRIKNYTQKEYKKEKRKQSKDGGMWFNALVESNATEEGETPKKIRMSLCIESSHIDKVSEIISDLIGNSLPYELIKVSVSNEY